MPSVYIPKGRKAKTLLQRFEEKVAPCPMSGCWIWTTFCNHLGYGRMMVTGKVCAAHRVSWELFRGPIPNGLDVCHKCDVRCCVNPYHLFVGTALDNILDALRKDRWINKLSPADVLAIRADTRTCKVVGLEYGVGPMQVSRIRRKVRWAHLA